MDLQLKKSRVDGKQEVHRGGKPPLKLFKENFQKVFTSTLLYDKIISDER